jgi:hydrogenase maturation protease
MFDNRIPAEIAEGAKTKIAGVRPDTPAPSVIVGLGNEIAGDDGIGLHIARILGDRLRANTAVDVVALPWAGFSLLDTLRGRTRAAIVDCLTTGTHPPGTIVRLDERGIAGSVRLNSFHDISLPTVLALGRQMGWDMPHDVAIWGIEADQVGVFHEGLSPAVASSVDPAIRQIEAFLVSPDHRPEPLEVLR